MTPPEPVCIVCGSASVSDPVARVGTWRKRASAMYSHCNACGVEFQNPMPLGIDEAYRDGTYRTFLKGDKGVDAKTLNAQYSRAEYVSRFIAARLRSARRHLDVGSSAGVLLEAVRMVYGNECHGVEIDREYAAYANKNDIRTTEEFPDLRFDLVTCVHTLEHLADPMAMLSKIADVADGAVYVEVPLRDWDVVHVVAWDEGSLETALRLAGFKVLEVGVNVGVHSAQTAIHAWCQGGQM